MGVYETRRQVLLTGAGEQRAELKAIFAMEPLKIWLVHEADSFERARFILQHEPWDVLLIDESLQSQDGAGVSWLTRHASVPWVFLAGAQPDVIANALAHGLGQWLLRDLALASPHLLNAALVQADRMGELRRQAKRAHQELGESRRQVDRLVGLLWESSPADPQTSWFTQRHMMDRLNEEVSRTVRHGIPLSVVLGEVQRNGQPGTRDEELPPISHWTAEQVTHAKRRADVAGQYGPQGFMLLLVHTPEAGAETFCRRLQKLIEKAHLKGSTGAVTNQAYFGIASYATDTTSNPKSLLSRAEERLEEAKKSREMAANT
ncbi:MAG: GGDEF domain-containing protein [Gemmataceae bacterium]